MYKPSGEGSMAEEKGLRVPQYRVIEQALEERIRTGAFSFDEPLCTESSLMAEFGSSRITVRRALEELENKGYITRKRGIGCFVSRGAYETMRASEAEPSAVHRQAAVYAFACPETWDSATVQAFFDGASEVMDAQDAHVVIYLMGSRAEEHPAALLTRFAGMDIAGAAIAAEDANALLPELNRLLLQGKAVMTFGQPSALPHIGSVSLDTADAARQMIAHLIALGHTRIAYLYADERSNADHLLAMAAHDLPIDPDLICRAGDAGALRRCIASGATVIAVQTADILQQLARDMTMLGLHVPGGMSLCCMESCPPLPALRRGEALRSVTCIQFDYRELGRRLAQKLLHLCSMPIRAAQHEQLPAALHTGATTAARKAPL